MNLYCILNLHNLQLLFVDSAEKITEEITIKQGNKWAEANEKRSWSADKKREKKVFLAYYVILRYDVILAPSLNTVGAGSKVDSYDDVNVNVFLNDNCL